MLGSTCTVADFTWVNRRIHVLGATPGHLGGRTAQGERKTQEQMA